MSCNSVKIAVQDCCSTTKPCLNHTMLSTCPLLDIEAKDACIQDVCSLACTPLCQSVTTDPCYVFQVLACCEKIEVCLQGWFGSQILSRIEERCSLTYKGNVSTDLIIIDLDKCQFDFEGLSLQCGHQTIPL